MEETVNNAVEEMTFGQKLSGLIMEPGKMFEQLSKFPPKTMDWLAPLLAIIVLASAMQFVIMGTPQLREQAVQMQMEQIEQRFQTAIEEGKMTQEQADQQLEMISNRMSGNPTMQLVFSVLAIVIFTFIFFFLMATVYFLLAKFIFGDNGSYSHAMLAYGMPMWIGAIGIVVLIIAMLASGNVMRSLSLASLLDIPLNSFYGFLMSRLNVFSIWFYGVLAVALAKLFKSDNTVKYLIGVYGLWLGFTTLIFLASDSVPFLLDFIR